MNICDISEEIGEEVLRGVIAHRVDDRCCGYSFLFDGHTVCFSVNSDEDSIEIELRKRLASKDLTCDRESDHEWRCFIGTRGLCVWEAYNHKGYRDGILLGSEYWIPSKMLYVIVSEMRVFEIIAERN